MHQGCQQTKAPEFGNGSWHGLNILSLTAKQNPQALTKSFVIHRNITWINKIKSQIMERVKHFMIKPQWEGVLGKTRRRWKGNVKIQVRKTGSFNINWLYRV